MITRAALLTSIFLFSATAWAQQEGVLHSVQANVFRPKHQPFSEDILKRLKVPDGFQVSVFARDLGNARMMAVAEDGTVYVTRPEEKDVIALKDGDSKPRVVASDLDGVHGVAIRDGRIYLATVHAVMAADLNADGTIGKIETVVDDLPDGGQHGRRTLAFAPDGALHINIGSSCDACFESSDEKAANLRLDLNSKRRTVFAKGLRNMRGFDWHPETGVMWGLDHGVDHLGDDLPGEELNKIEEGVHYGWPFCYGDRQPDWVSFTMPEGAPKDEFCSTKTVGPALTFDAHASVINIRFYDAEQFPEEYRNDAFVTLRGSANRADPAGYKVVRVNFDKGEPTGTEDFLTGFLSDDRKMEFGRLAGLAIAPDGSLLVSEDTNGVIFRITYRAGAN
ncbi:L-sorbosone dehydrogenase [Sinorhizobium sojae CCBAU 05684]|uniref:L-sorbosone dehydrogenase n=1 Tax=Sinorhizobium sojae CCBAU 05684 TaxID=716928 RepID=A0A249PF05_9HYPH|nr:PQQ-dependent sugar dehydrogenase [Sinorhizobium sojae]ASY63829.1 L-sorbosone dehydrogenase [Sinorhizobium sojae CCBAU 05684]